jgi:hypothetical protein
VALERWEWEYNGLRWGGGKAIVVDDVAGLGMPALRASSEPKLVDHGAYSSARWMPERHFTMQGRIADTDLSSTFDRATQLAQALVPRPDGKPLPLVFRAGDGILKEIHCVSLRYEVPIDRQYANGYIRWLAEFLAGDPRIYENGARGVGIVPRDLDPGGVVFPVVFPIDFGGGAGGIGIATNIGTIPTPPYLHLAGPATNPTVQHDATGRFLKFNIALSTSDFLDVDFDDRTITLNGTASRYDTLDPASQWWSLDPGDNAISFFADGTSSQTLATLTWQSAWAVAV